MSHRLAAAAFAAASLFAATAAAQQIRLVHGSFDPAASASLEIAELLRGDASTNLWIVQFDGAPTQDGRDLVAGAGGEIHGYLPDNAYVVRMDIGVAANVRKLGLVRAVAQYHPAFRLEPLLRQALALGEALPAAKYNIVVVDKHSDKPALIRSIRALGGIVTHEQEGSLLLEVQLTGKQLAAAARLDQVLWIDRWTPDEEDMDNARIQGGGNYVESTGGYTGSGVNTHIYEGVQASHYDFTGTVTVVRSTNSAQSHGHATAGIVFGNGTSNPAVRGMAPDAGKFFTNYTSVSTSRYQVVADLVNIHNVSHTTASWGGGRTRSYTSTSASTDDIIFDHDMAWTQSQSNAGNQDSRPEAWAKNVFSIGGVAHRNNSNPGDDSWAAGGASTGPAADGRIKPTLCAYYDGIGTSDRTGSAGYSNGDWTSSFGGTSGATPIVAGHNTLAIQMFTDGIFGNTLRNPGGSRHSNRPKFTTLKALQVANAAQYSFSAGSSDNRREHQGWGFPDLRAMYDNRAKTIIVDETDVLSQGQSTSYNVSVAPGEADLKVCMTYSDPAANPSANPTRINNLSVRVTSPSGTTYWGNNGLNSGVWSNAGGVEDNVNTVECVFVQNPAAGNWTVDVLATLVVQDSHVETPGVDADYGLVIRGGTGSVQGAFETFGAGCAAVTCPTLNNNGGPLTGEIGAHEYAFRVSNTGPITVTGFQVYTRSTGLAPVSVDGYVYAASGNQPAAFLTGFGSSEQIFFGENFYTVTLNSPVTFNGDFYIGLNISGGEIWVPSLNNGTAGSAHRRSPAFLGSWQTAPNAANPAFRVFCDGPTPAIGNVGVPAINSSFQISVSNAPANELALLVLGYNNTSFSGGLLPYALPGTVGCDLLVSPDDYTVALTNGAGAATLTLNVPNLPTLVGINTYHQWLVAAPGVNPLGVVSSDAGETVVGQ